MLGLASAREGLDDDHAATAAGAKDGELTAVVMLLVQVGLASPSRTAPDRDQQQLVTARFLTEYIALDKFASSLE